MASAVIDASVLVKWFVKEPDSDKALALRDRHVNGDLRLAAPSLIVCETLNALRYTRLFSTRELKDASAAIQSYGLSLHGPERQTAELAIEAAEENDVTIYDGSYLGLAMELGTDFITADKELVARLRGDYIKITKQLDATP
jgi:predicted nucleic acid-binding protein